MIYIKITKNIQLILVLYNMQESIEFDIGQLIIFSIKV